MTDGSEFKRKYKRVESRRGPQGRRPDEPPTFQVPSRPADPKDMVRRGYDVASYSYRSDSGEEAAHYAPWLRELITYLPPGGDILDLGCGNGIPAARFLDDSGFRVTGIDFSEVQIERATSLVPGAKFICADMVEIDLPESSFDAAISFYAIIHVPLEEQSQLLRNLAKWLKPGGYLLSTLGWRAWTGTEDNWHGATMFWSHAGEDTYRSWLQDAGFRVERCDFVSEDDGGRSLFLSRKI